MGGDDKDKRMVASQNIEESESEDDRELRNTMKVSRRSTGKPCGRRRGRAAPVPWTFDEINKLFLHVVKKCPPALTGIDVLEEMSVKLPGRSESAIQSFISHKFRQEVKSCIYFNYDRDYSRLSRRQRLYLAQLLDENDSVLRGKLMAFDDAEAVQTARPVGKAGVTKTVRSGPYDKPTLKCTMKKEKSEQFEPNASSTPCPKRKLEPALTEDVIQSIYEQVLAKFADRQQEKNPQVSDPEPVEVMNEPDNLLVGDESSEKPVPVGNSLKARVCTITVVVIEEEEDEDSTDVSPLTVSKIGREYVITHDPNEWSMRAECGFNEKTLLQDFIQTNDVFNLSDKELPPMSKLIIKDSPTKKAKGYKTLYMKDNNGMKYPILFAAGDMD